MARPRKATPSYLLHRQSGQARVRINGTDVLLGPYGSKASWEKYHRVLAQSLATSETDDARIHDPAGRLTIAELVEKYDEFAERYYVKDGTPTDERYKAVIGPLTELFGKTPADEFGPLRLKAVRQSIVARGNSWSAKFNNDGKLTKAGKPLSREYVNNLIKSLVRMFKWAAGEELLPAAVHDALSKVDGLRKGKADHVREPVPVKPVPDEHFWPVVTAAPPQVAAMIQVQYWAGGRPDEITIMRPCDIYRTDAIWSYVPSSHKVEHHDIEREILLGPEAQKVLLPWLENRKPTEYLFSPREAALANAAALEKRRKKPSKKPVGISKKRPPREHYDDVSYRQAVERACERAGVPKWTPGQLRHNAGTRVRQQLGAEAAQMVLGHRNLSTTEIYAEKNRKQYVEIMKKMG